MPCVLVRVPFKQNEGSPSLSISLTHTHARTFHSLTIAISVAGLRASLLRGVFGGALSRAYYHR